MRISDWSSDVCSSDLLDRDRTEIREAAERKGGDRDCRQRHVALYLPQIDEGDELVEHDLAAEQAADGRAFVPRHAHQPHDGAKDRADHRLERQVGIAEPAADACEQPVGERDERSEEHTSELQSLMRISYAGFCLKKKN